MSSSFQVGLNIINIIPDWPLKCLVQGTASSVQTVCDEAAVCPTGRASGCGGLLGHTEPRQGQRQSQGVADGTEAVDLDLHAGRSRGLEPQLDIPRQPPDGAVRRRPAVDHVGVPGAGPAGAGRGLPGPVRHGAVGDRPPLHGGLQSAGRDLR